MYNTMQCNVAYSHILLRLEMQSAMKLVRCLIITTEMLELPSTKGHILNGKKHIFYFKENCKQCNTIILK